MATQMTRGAVFSRESKGKGASIDDQDRENFEAAAELGADVQYTLRDKVSASRFGTKARAGWPQVIELVEGRRIDVLILWEISRGDRVMDTWVPFISACRDNDVLIHVTSDATTYDPRRAAHRKALLDAGTQAEGETEKISARARKGIVGAVLEGKAHGPSAYGYTRVYGPIVNGRRTFTESPDEHAPTVIEVITRVARRDPVNAIIRDLTEAEIFSPRGGVWTTRSIKRMVMNVTYLGKRQHNGTTHEGNWPPISDSPDWEQTYWRAVSVLTEEERRRTRPGQTKHLLGYLVTAGGCVVDGRMSMDPRTRTGGLQPRYKCNRCGCVGIGAAELEELVLRLILDRLSRPDARRFFTRGAKVLEVAKAELARLEQQLEEALDSFEDPNGGISAEAHARKERRLLPLLENARTKVLEARRMDAVLHIFGDDEYVEAVARERWAAASLLARREVIKAMFQCIELWPVPYVLARRKLTRHSSFADRVAMAADRVTARWVDHEASEDVSDE